MSNLGLTAKCGHGIYAPLGNTSYCTICSPDSIGPLRSPTEQEIAYWNTEVRFQRIAEDFDAPGACPGCGSYLHTSPDEKHPRRCICDECGNEYTVSKDSDATEQRAYLNPFEVFPQGRFQITSRKPRKECPEWMYDSAKVQAIVSSYSRSEEQTRKRALALWLYYRLAHDSRRVARELGLTVGAVEQLVGKCTRRAEADSARVTVHSCRPRWKIVNGDLKQMTQCRCAKRVTRRVAKKMVDRGEADYRIAPAANGGTRTDYNAIVLRFSARAPVATVTGTNLMKWLAGAIGFSKGFEKISFSREKSWVEM